MGVVRTFYRIVKTNPPTADDFMPRPLRQNVGLNPRLRELASGISLWTTQAQAQRAAREVPKLGRYIARLEFVDSDWPRIEKTLDRGHFTVWGDSALLHASVVQTDPVGS